MVVKKKITPKFKLTIAKSITKPSFDAKTYEAVVSNILKAYQEKDVELTNDVILRSFINYALDTNSLASSDIFCVISIGKLDEVLIDISTDLPIEWNVSTMSNIMLANANTFIQYMCRRPPCEKCAFWKPAPHYNLEQGAFVATICCIAKERMQDFSCFTTRQPPIQG